MASMRMPDPVRLARAVIVYLAGTAAVVFGYANIGVLTDYYVEAAMVTILFGAILAFYLGYASGTIWSIPFLAVGLLLGELPNTPLAQGNFSYWDGTMNSLSDFWQPFTLFAFLPAWVLGRVLDRAVDRSLADQAD